MFTIVLLAIMTVTAGIPAIVKLISYRYPKLKLHKTYNWLPLLAAACFVGAFFLPDIHISMETSTFQQHFVGGGVYCALFFIYFQKLLGWKANWALSLILLFAWTSTFGVANELMEFTLTKLHLARIGTGDVDWDLLANTAGSVVAYVLYLTFKNISNSTEQKKLYLS